MLLGRGKKDSSLKASKHQAQDAAALLVEYSKQYQCVVIIGHGGMNWLIRQKLREQGWAVEGNPSSRHFGVTTLTMRA